MKNEFLIKNSEVIIKVASLDNEIHDAIIDLESLHLIQTIDGRWRAKKEGNIIYVVGDEKRMHRIILNARKGEIIDHINHNGLDNRLKNLRVVSNSENGLNRSVVNKKNKNSKFQNIFWDKRTSRWKASIIVQGKKHFFGYFDDKYEALDVVQKFKEENVSSSLESSIAKGIVNWDENMRKWV